MTARCLPAGKYGFDDLNVGDWLDAGSAQITVAEIDAFADMTGDRFEIHMDAAAARAHGFADRVAHGLLVLARVDGLKNMAPAQFRAVASLGWDWNFRRPVLAGNRISVRIVVQAKRVTKRADRGILTLEFSVRNQSGEIVQEGTNLLMVQRAS